MSDKTVPQTATVHPQAAFIAGLREIADFYERHPDMPMRHPDIRYCVLGDDDEAGAVEIQRVAAILGVPAKREGYSASVERSFGSVRLGAYYVSRRRSELYTEHMKGYRSFIEPDVTE